jgi:uncharacterized protein (UPF0335 family)
MAKKSATAARPPENEIAERARPFLREIEELLERLESRRGEYMAVCKSLRHDIRDVYDRAKDRGVSTKPLKTLVKNNALARKIERHVADLDIDEAAIYSHLADALGELGVAAARRAGYPPGTGNGGAETARRDASPGEIAGEMQRLEDEKNLAKLGETLGRP